MSPLVQLRVPAAVAPTVASAPRLLALMLLWSGLAAATSALLGHPLAAGWLGLFLTFGPILIGGSAYLVLTYGGKHPGIHNDYLQARGATARGVSAYVLSAALLAFYSVLYWHADTLNGLIRVCDPLSLFLRGRAADQWFLYGFIYTFAVLFMGVRMFFRYRHNRYQLVRSASVMFFQLGFSFVIPGLLIRFQQHEYYFTYFWPLKYDYLFPGSMKSLFASGGVGVFMVVWGVVAAFVLTPVLTYLYGKRWYCSWVCGCGGLAETAGDPYRHLSDKTKRSWRIERWTIHTVLVLVVVCTAAQWINSASNGRLLGETSQRFSSWYGFFVGALLSGIVGVGFYPLLGSRVWCRFFCPLAALMGIIQRFYSRFRITTNGGQCISCGNCSTYCEMGIDVRWYAERGKNIVRASCVGCGICAAVCPRGVLKLENGTTHADRFDGADKPGAELMKSLRS